MDSTIVAAIIGGIFTIGASIGTFAITRIFDSNLLLVTRNVRQKSLTGQWKGPVHQEGGIQGTPIDIQLALTLRSTRRVVRGEGFFTGAFQNQTFNTTMTILGGFVHERFLKLEYEYKSELVQFGFVLLELSPDGRTLEGQWMGFGPISRKLVSGSMQLHKQGSFSHLPTHP